MSRSPGCLDEDREAMLDAALPVRRAAFGRLLSGHVATFDQIVATTGWSEGSVREAAENVASVGMAEIDGTNVVGMDGLTSRETQHCLSFGGVELCTWCAYDVVGIAAALGSDATGATRCGMCGRGIEIAIHSGYPGDGDVVGWLPEEACADVMAEFCPRALLFCSAEHLESWRLQSEAGHGEALDLRGLAERGRDEWGQLVASSSR
jgi:hypothetical protein